MSIHLVENYTSNTTKCPVLSHRMLSRATSKLIGTGELGNATILSVIRCHMKDMILLSRAGNILWHFLGTRVRKHGIVFLGFLHASNVHYFFGRKMECVCAWKKACHRLRLMLTSTVYVWSWFVWEQENTQCMHLRCIIYTLTKRLCVYREYVFFHRSSSNM
jgi:hypothetical protein